MQRKLGLGDVPAGHHKQEAERKRGIRVVAALKAHSHSGEFARLAEASSWSSGHRREGLSCASFHHDYLDEFWRGFCTPISRQNTYRFFLIF